MVQNEEYGSNLNSLLFGCEYCQWIKLCLVTQEAVYITLMLRKFGLADTNIDSMPANCKVKLVNDAHVSKSSNQVEYQLVVDSLLYVAMGICPDNTHAVGGVSKFCS